MALGYWGGLLGVHEGTPEAGSRGASEAAAREAAEVVAMPTTPAAVVATPAQSAAVAAAPATVDGMAGSAWPAALLHLYWQ